MSNKNLHPGFTQILILVIIALVVLSIAGYFVLASKSTILKQSETSKTTNSIVDGTFPTIPGAPVELTNVPVYPNSKYEKMIGDFTTLHCPDRHLCKVSTYNLTTKDSLEKILTWYRSLSSWKFSESKNYTSLPSVQLIDSKLINSSKYIVFDITSPGLDGFSHLNELGITYYFPGEDFTWPSVSKEEVFSWVEYKSPDNSFSYKHPKDWIQGDGTFYLSPECIHCGGVRSYFQIVKTENTELLTSEEIVKKQLEKDYPDGRTQEKLIINKPSSLSGLDATVVAGIPGAGSPGPNIYIVKGGKTIKIESDSLDLETLSKVVSTFKFTN